jgi:hypothetical protein
MFITKITDSFMPGLDVMQAYDTMIDLKRHVLRLGEEEVSLWCLEDRPRSSLLMMGNDEVIPASCERG